VSADDAAPPERYRQRDPWAKWWQADTRTRTVAIETGFVAHPGRHDERAAPDLDLGVVEAVSGVLVAADRKARAILDLDLDVPAMTIQRPRRGDLEVHGIHARLGAAMTAVHAADDGNGSDGPQHNAAAQDRASPESPRHPMQHSHPDFDRSPIATA
jgi:hypothetical protein